MGEGSVVRLDRHDHLAVVTIRREHKRNAIDAEVTAGLSEAFDAIEDDPACWAAVLTGGTSVFCAGTDLAVGPGEPTKRGGEYGLIRRRRTVPLVAAVEGVAFGGGFELAMACDLVVAAEGARFALPEVKRGVVANSGAVFRAARLLPPHVAKELLLVGDEIDAAEAHRLGFANRVVPDGDALAEALALATRIAANAPVAVTHTLQAVDAVTVDEDERGWEATARAQAAVLASEDLMEGIGAFFERRPPRWTGR